MQITFKTEYLAQDFSTQNSNIFPTAPTKCPFKDCLSSVKLKKHGYYQRFFISKSFTGILYIRRYICPVCGKTVSMIPVFCIPRFQYSGVDIISLLHKNYQSGISLTKLIKDIKSLIPSITRRHLNYYRKRIAENRGLIQYALNIMSPEFISSGTIPETPKWVKVFLEKVQNLQPLAFFDDFFKITGKSFLTLQNIIA